MSSDLDSLRSHAEVEYKTERVQWIGYAISATLLAGAMAHTVYADLPFWIFLIQLMAFTMAQYMSYKSHTSYKFHKYIWNNIGTFYRKDSHE